MAAWACKRARKRRFTFASPEFTNALIAPDMGPVACILGLLRGCATIHAMKHQHTLSALYEPIAPALEEVRGVMKEIWGDVLRLVHCTAAAAGETVAEGKLLRPALCLLAAGTLGEQDLRPYSRLAAAYEAMHLASLAHDDVVDHASLRRGQYALNVLWDEHAAVLGGDYLVARALEMLLEYRSLDIISAATRVVRRMSEGELRFFGRDADKATEEDCITLADTKTASLFAAACSAPACLINPASVSMLYDFGIALGIAFQLVDDLLDISQPASVLGKPSCGDVAEGKQTLPLILLRQRMDDRERKALEALQGVSLTDRDCAWVRDCSQRLDIPVLLNGRVNTYIETAIERLHCFPSSPFRDSMEGLARFILVRVS